MRRQKLSTELVRKWYDKTYVKCDSKGRSRRYIRGDCEVCGEMIETLWGNFSRCNRHQFRFAHLTCAQKVWNNEQRLASLNKPIEEQVKRLVRKYQHGCKTRKLEWRLDLMDCIHLFSNCCFYCGAEPASKIGTFFYNGIDRRNNAVGYTHSNCVTCCRRCNFLKRDMTYDEWVKFLNDISNFWKG